MSTGTRTVYDLLRDALDVVEVAEGEGLRVSRRRGASTVYFDCPACAKKLHGGTPPAMTKDRARWCCVRCDVKGDAVDLIGYARRLFLPGLPASDEARAKALRAACELAGIDPAATRQPLPAWKVRELEAKAAARVRRSSPSAPEPLDARELAARSRAMSLAAWHYVTLAGWHPRDHGEADRDGPSGDDRPTAREHLEHLADMVAPHKVPRLYPVDFPRGDVARLLERAAAARSYVRRRLGMADGEVVPEVVRELVGVCPAQVTGLEALLNIHGGAALVEAAVDAGIFRRVDGRLVEAFAGRIVYVWTDARERAVYLTARAVDVLSDAGEKRFAYLSGRVPKVRGLPVFDPERRGDRSGVSRVEVPFGLHHARTLAPRSEDRSVFVVEGELDALAALVAGFPAVATGGTGRMDNERGHPLLRDALEGLAPVVSFDADPEPDKRQKADAHSRRLAHAIGGTRGRWLPAGSLSDAIHEAHEGPGRGLGAPGILRRHGGPEQGSGACDPC